MLRLELEGREVAEAHSSRRSSIPFDAIELARIVRDVDPANSTGRVLSGPEIVGARVRSLDETSRKMPSELFEGPYFCQTEDEVFFDWARPLEGHPTIARFSGLCREPPGDTGFRAWETRYAKVGVGIYSYQWYPECARAMALQGAEVLLYPTAIGSEPIEIDNDTRDPWQRGA